MFSLVDPRGQRRHDRDKLDRQPDRHGTAGSDFSDFSLNSKTKTKRNTFFF